MPELPEVEVIRLRLCQTFVNRKVEAARVIANDNVFMTPPRELRKRLVGQRFMAIHRRGKYLLFVLEDQSCLVIHLGMTGQLFSGHAMSPRLQKRSSRPKTRSGQSARFEPDRHTHLSLTFADSGEQLHFRDCRKFGKISWIAAGCSNPRLDRLGPDALTITRVQFEAGLKGRRIAIKSLLLDQSTLAGVGNIYADESLHVAKIAPSRAAHTLRSEEIGVLVHAIRRTLRQAIAHGGSSIDDYVRPDGSDGGFQKRFAVYGRRGEPCRRCGELIRRTVIGQRGTHYCAGCQR
jgi:formamidopyrimidine-DNA glycosylase